MKIRLIVVQPTSRCNLNCRYCYVPGRKDSEVITEATLENILAKCLRSPLVDEYVEILWHAGEPLTAGIPFYKKALEMIPKYNIQNRKVLNSVQTNGTLITEEWCRFFSENGFHVGISIDGPAFLHNLNRKDWGGRDTHHLVMRGANLLQAHEIPFGGLCVLTKESLDFPDEIFDFFYSNSFRWIGFNVEEIENANKETSLKESDIAEKYRAFMSRFFDLWFPKRNEITVREFSSMSTVIRNKLADHNYSCTPDEIRQLGIITIQKNGSITTNSPEFAGGQSLEFNNFIVGNINEIDELSDIQTSGTYRSIQEAIQLGVKNCAGECLYFDLCGGGSPSNKFFENGSLSSTKTTSCILHKQVLAATVIEKMTGKQVGS